MLSDDEAKRRIEAARILRGLTQEELDRLGAADGLGKQELSRTERGEIPLTRVRKEVFARLLRLPLDWFESETIDPLIRQPATTKPGDIELPQRLERLEASVRFLVRNAAGQPLEDLLGEMTDETTRALLGQDEPQADGPERSSDDEEDDGSEGDQALP